MADPLTIGLMVGGTVLSAIGQRNEGIAAKNAAIGNAQAKEYEQKQMNVQAGQERAAAQRQYIDQQKRKRMAQSKVTALAAAQGNAGDASVIDILGDLEQEGTYNANSVMYEGEDRARDLESGAVLKGYEATQYRASGKAAKKAGNLAAVTTLFSGGSKVAGSSSFQTLLDKYG